MRTSILVVERTSRNNPHEITNRKFNWNEFFLTFLFKCIQNYRPSVFYSILQNERTIRCLYDINHHHYKSNYFKKNIYLLITMLYSILVLGMVCSFTMLIIHLIVGVKNIYANASTFNLNINIFKVIYSWAWWNLKWITDRT